MNESNDNNKRLKMRDEFACMNDGLGIEFVNPIFTPDVPKNKSGASGFIRMIERGLMRQIPGEPFIPFILLEDDVSFLHQFSFNMPPSAVPPSAGVVAEMNGLLSPEDRLLSASTTCAMRKGVSMDPNINNEIDVPDDADILYIGISCCSMNADSFEYANYYESVQSYPSLVRVKNMLASHGIIICSPLGASAMQRTMMETWFSDRPWDVPMAYIQPYYHVYALRKPLVYQNAAKGGDESCTIIMLEGDGITLPFEYINCDLATIVLPDKRLV